MSESICMYNKEYDLAIGPNGSIYKCVSGIGLERFKVSSRDEVMEKPEFFIVRHAKFLGLGKGDHTCPSCRFFPVCGGGCEYNAYVQGCKKDCWQRFHEIALPKMVEILSSIDFVEPDIWVKRSGN
ncbi:MAG: hypothetical protein DDT23_01111 [candidate division WS2 bacterium]|nr:hypothetical protein [Candidatus Lithacetigena glycinireducens]